MDKFTKGFIVQSHEGLFRGDKCHLMLKLCKQMLCLNTQNCFVEWNFSLVQVLRFRKQSIFTYDLKFLLIILHRKDR